MSESIHAAPPFVHRQGSPFPSRTDRPTARAWARHAALFLLTALTMTLAGVLLAPDLQNLPESAIQAPEGWLEYLLFLPAIYFDTVGAVVVYASTHPALLAEGVKFAGALSFVLLAHEAGHYIACRLYGVEATLPFFIPAPPLFLAGTFGAFIKIKSPIPSRRALFDIGVAGPLAGFAALLPVATVAMLTARPHASPLPAEGVIIFNDPPLIQLAAMLFGVEDLSNIAPNSFYFAAWVGLLVTSLNLLPVGQLDGGHAVYAIFGAGAHRRVGRLAFLLMAALAPLGLVWHGSPSGFVYSLLLIVMLRLRHPQAEDELDDLGTTRLLVALLTLFVFLLSFTPFPLTIK